jgi:long-chain acyl-CoA synthetase
MLSPRRLLPSDLPFDHQGPVSLITVPLFHIGGVTTVAANLLCGGRMVFPTGRFDAAEVLELIEQERVTTWGAIPTMVSRTLHEAEGGEAPKRDLASLRSLIMGGAGVPDRLLSSARRVFPGLRSAPGNTYGLTEASGHVATATGRDAAENPGSSGRALPTVELRIVPVPETPPDTGEVLVRSPSTLIGYWREPDGQAVDECGWLHTGDLGRLDDEGRLWIVGRIKDIVIRGGENVAPGRVESRLLRHPLVREAAVIGLPHEDLGEEVAAVVVVEAGVTVEELRAFASAELASFEVPSRWWLRREALPVNGAGKVLKQEIAAAWPPRPAVVD